MRVIMNVSVYLITRTNVQYCYGEGWKVQKKWFDPLLIERKKFTEQSVAYQNYVWFQLKKNKIKEESEKMLKQYRHKYVYKA